MAASAARLEAVWCFRIDLELRRLVVGLERGLRRFDLGDIGFALRSDP